MTRKQLVQQIKKKKCSGLLIRAKMMKTVSDIEWSFHSSIFLDKEWNPVPKNEYENVLIPMFNRWIENEMVSGDFIQFVWHVTGLAHFNVLVNADLKRKQTQFRKKNDVNQLLF